jgi:host factor-I protein
MSNEPMLEQNFINKLIQDKTPVSIFLKNGIKLTGVFVGVDEEALFLKNIIIQMIYKHAASTIMGSSQ